MPLLVALNVFNNRWPPFGSNVKLELFEDASYSGYTVRGFSNIYAGIRGWMQPSLKDAAAPAVTSSVKYVAASSRKAGSTMSAPKYEMKSATPFYVRVSYNGATMVIPECAKPGNHYGPDNSLCTLEAFREVVKKVIPTSYKDECASSTKST